MTTLSSGDNRTGKATSSAINLGGESTQLFFLPDVLKQLEKKLKLDSGFNYHSHFQKNYAQKFNVSASFMSQVLRGHKKPTAAMLDYLGLEEKTVYVRREQKQEDMGF